MLEWPSSSRAGAGGLRLTYRHFKCEAGFIFARRNIQRPAMRTGNFRCDEQPQSEALQRLLHGTPIKRQKQLRYRGRRDRVASVRDR
jgi:hypothetical protein